jgi:hypothetical protein
MKKETQEPPTSAEYKQMLDLLVIYCQAANQLAEMQARADSALLHAQEAASQDYADCQTAMADTKASLEIIARAHPEWFGERASLKTPFGALQFRSGVKLEIANEEMTIILVEQAAKKDESLALALKTVKTLNLEVLEKLDDAELARYRVKRVETKGFNVKPAKVELGRAVSTQEQAEGEEAFRA